MKTTPESRFSRLNHLSCVVWALIAVMALTVGWWIADKLIDFIKYLRT